MLACHLGESAKGNFYLPVRVPLTRTKSAGGIPFISLLVLRLKNELKKVIDFPSPETLI